MKFTHLATATAAVALLGSAAWAQDPKPGSEPAAPPAATATPPVDQASPPSTDTAPPADTTAPAVSTTTTSTAASTDVTAPAATGQNVSVTTMTVTNGPVPDTAENRAKYGQPMSRAGKRTAASGN